VSVWNYALLDLPEGFRVFFEMDVSSRTGAVVAIFILTFILNLLFGYFRAKSRKYSLKWFVYIHLPIPVILIARITSGLDFRFVPVFVFAAVLGQIVGGRVDF